MEDFEQDLDFENFEDDCISIPMSTHDYGDGCFSFGYDYMSDHLLELPLAEGFYFEEHENGAKKRQLRYCDKNGVMKLHPFNDVTHFIKKYGEHLVGPVDQPYEYFDLWEQFIIVDRGDYVCVLDFSNVASALASGFRVKRDEYYKAYNDFLASNGIDPIKY